MFKEKFNFRLHNGTRSFTFNFTKVLELKDRHVQCPYCNYGGCDYKTQGYKGHFNWTIKLLFGTLKKRVNHWIKSWSDFDYSKIDDIEVDGIDTRDYPDFCDAYISYATYKGKEMTESQLERLNEDSSFVYECVQERLY